MTSDEGDFLPHAAPIGVTIERDTALSPLELSRSSRDLTRSIPHSETDAFEARLALAVIQSLDLDATREQRLHALLPNLLSLLGCDRGGLVIQRSGRWIAEQWIGEPRHIPESLVAEAVDRAQPCTDRDWVVAPLPMATRLEGTTSPSSLAVSASAAALIGHFAVPATEPSAQRVRSDCAIAVARSLAIALQQIDRQRRQVNRIEQLTAVLNAAAEWQRLDDDDALLHRIADTATRLLNCDRASIFLWDRRRRKLIGRPALGVQGDQLEVDDNAGVVGEVLASGEARIWNGGSDDESRVNRKVDRSLAFQTHSLVAVPMSGPRDGLIGVFEAINHRGDGFGDQDAQLLADLAKHAAVAIQVQRTRRQLTEARDRLVNDAASTAHLIGDDPKIDAVRRASLRVAKTDLTVLVLGRNGTGKEVLARYIHFESQRRSGPFIAVNCAALVETLLESELFGHERGAFTDAHATRPGKFELATGGTLVLDEVGDMSPGGQAKLLRVLEEKVVVRVGGSQPIPVDVRVIAATNQPLEELIRQKRFREDLFFRLNVVSLSLPPLAERGDDVFVLADHFLKQFCYQIGRQVPQWLPSAKHALKSHPWPGNIRELRNTIERVTYLCTEDKIGAEDLDAEDGRRFSQRAAAHLKPRDARRCDARFSGRYIQRAIDACEGNMTDAAARLGLHRSNLYRKMKQLGIPTSE